MEVVYRQKGGPHNVLLREGQSRKEWAMGSMEVPGERVAEGGGPYKVFSR